MIFIIVWYFLALLNFPFPRTSNCQSPTWFFNFFLVIYIQSRLHRVYHTHHLVVDAQPGRLNSPRK